MATENLIKKEVRFKGPFVAPPVMPTSTWRAFRYKWAQSLPSEARRPIGSEAETADWVRAVLSAPSLGDLRRLGGPVDAVSATVAKGRPAVEYDRQEHRLHMTLSMEHTAPGLLAWHVAEGILSPDLASGGLVHLLFTTAIIRELFGVGGVRTLGQVLEGEKTAFKWFGLIAEEAGLLQAPKRPLSLDAHVMNERLSARAWLPQRLESNEVTGAHSGFFPGRETVMTRPDHVLFRCLDHGHNIWLQRGDSLLVRFGSSFEPVNPETVSMMEEALQVAWQLRVSAREVA